METGARWQGLFAIDRSNMPATSRQLEQGSVLTWPDTCLTRSKVGVRVKHRSINFCITTKIQTGGARYRQGRVIDYSHSFTVPVTCYFNGCFGMLNLQLFLLGYYYPLNSYSAGIYIEMISSQYAHNAE